MRLIDADVVKTLFDVRYDTAFIQERTRENKEQWNGYCTGINWGRNTIADAPTVDAMPLHCRIGDTVWIVGTKCMSGLYDNECPDKSEWNSFDDFCEDCPLVREYIVFPRTVNSFNFAYIHDLEHNSLFRWGETVFKTKKEAEAALAKMD